MTMIGVHVKFGSHSADAQAGAGQYWYGRPTVVRTSVLVLGTCPPPSFGKLAENRPLMNQPVAVGSAYIALRPTGSGPVEVLTPAKCRILGSVFQETSQKVASGPRDT